MHVHPITYFRCTKPNDISSLVQEMSMVPSTRDENRCTYPHFMNTREGELIFHYREGEQGPGMTHTPMAMVHATLQPDAALDLPWNPEFNALVYVLSGEGTVGVERRPIRTGNLAVLGRGDLVTLAASRAQESRSPALDVLVIGGRPIREPLAWAGPFVMNTKAEVMTAFEDFQAGRLGTIPAVHGL
jgi:redox-sensitive bicupin YhaK (pirin superfamily)